MAYTSPATIAMRRIWLALACVLVWAGQAQAQFTLVGQDVGTCSGSTTCTVDNAVTAQAGDLAILMLQSNSPSGAPVCMNTSLTVSDATNGAYTLPASAAICDDNNTERSIAGAYFIGSGAAALAPTMTVEAAFSGSYHFSVFRPQGTVTADQFNESQGSTGTSQSHGSITTTGAGLIVTGSRQSVDGGAETVATGFTEFSNNQGESWFDYYQYKITTTGETTTGPYTSSNSIWNLGIIMSFLDSGGGGGATCNGGILLLGAGKCD